jgi:hypothetical protein
MIVSDDPCCRWRRVVGCIAAYALALHGILVAFVGLPAANNDGTLSFELCSVIQHDERNQLFGTARR